MPPHSESHLRQAKADREYIQACRDAGIEPDAPQYFASGETSEAALLDAHALREGALAGFPPEIANDEEAALDAEPLNISKQTRAGIEGILNLLLPAREHFSKTDALIAGKRALVLAWKLGRGPVARVSLAEIARRLECSRASLSLLCRQIEDATSIHNRGQKNVTARPNYVAGRKRVLERKKAEKQDARIDEDAILGGEQGFAIAED